MTGRMTHPQDAACNAHLKNTQQRLCRLCQWYMPFLSPLVWHHHCAIQSQQSGGLPLPGCNSQSGSTGQYKQANPPPCPPPGCCDTRESTIDVPTSGEWVEQQLMLLLRTGTAVRCVAGA